MNLSLFSKKALRFVTRPPERDRRVNILWGSVRSQKTYAMIAKIIRLCAYQVEGHRILVGTSKETVYNNVLSILFDVVGPGKYSYNRQTGKLKIFGVDWIVIGVKDEGSERYIRGLTAGIVVIDEATLMPEPVFMMLWSRLSPRGARLYATTNPDNPMHYLKTKVFENEQLLARGDIWTEQFYLRDNLSLDEDTILSYEARYQGVFYRRFILGEWVGAEGAIYAELVDGILFDDATRPVGLLGSGGFVARYIGVDYGTTNPCVFLDVYDDGRTLWQVREYYYDSRKSFKQKTDSEYAEDLEKFIGPQRRGLVVVIDPSAASFKVELQKRGIATRDANNDVLPGIRHVSSLLGKKQYRIHKDCVNTRREFSSYAWDEKAAKHGDEKPIKTNDHSCDAARYLCQTMIPQWRLGV